MERTQVRSIFVCRKRNQKMPVPLGFDAIFLLKVTLQQAFQSAAVASLVACHFVNGVVDGIHLAVLNILYAKPLHRSIRQEVDELNGHSFLRDSILFLYFFSPKPNKARNQTESTKANENSTTKE